MQKEDFQAVSPESSAVRDVGVCLFCIFIQAVEGPAVFALAAFKDVADVAA